MADFSEERYKHVLEAVNGGDKSLLSELAMFMLTGRGGAEKDVTGAVELLKECVSEHADNDAMWILGLCYENGEGVETDKKQAVSLYKRSRDAGNETGLVLSSIHSTKSWKKIRLLLFLVSCRQTHGPFHNWFNV